MVTPIDAAGQEGPPLYTSFDVDDNGVGYALCDNNRLSSSAVATSQAIVYPNPSGAYFQIGIEQQVRKKIKASVIVYDKKGHVVISEKHANEGAKISTAALPDGMYFVRITCNDKVYHSQLRVQH